MPYYEDDIIEEIRSRIDIVDVISQYVSLQKKGNSHFGLCPFHNEKTGSFSVSSQKQMYYCFGCGAGGNVYTFLMNYENFSFSEAVEYLAPKAGVVLPQKELTPEERKSADKKSQLRELTHDAAEFFYGLLRSEQGKRAYEYFENRQLSKETMRKFGLGYADQYRDSLYRYLKEKGYQDRLIKESGLVSYSETGVYDKFWNRAMFPILNESGKVVAFGGRVMGEGEPKYLNSPETDIFHKSETMYGMHLARRSRRNEFILCEGYMDVIALHQAGFDNAVASLGTALTQGHATLMRKYKKTIYLCYDSDEAGTKAALRGIPILREAGLSAKVISLAPYKDPDEFIKALGREAFEQRLEQAKNSFLFTIEMKQKAYNFSDPEDKTKFFQEVAKELLVFEEELERNNYIESVARLYQIPTPKLQALVNRYAGGAKIAPAKKYKSGIHKKTPQEDNSTKSQRLLLTWLVENPAFYQTVKSYISVEDFEEGIYKEVAKELFSQFQQETKLHPASIISKFSEDEEQQRIVAQIFNTSVGEIRSEQEWEKALKETMISIKQNALQRMQTSSNLEDWNALLEAKQTLQELMKGNISLI